MSKPTKLSEIRVGDKVPSAAPLPALIQGTGRSPNLTGAVGALVTGGPSVGAVQLKSTTVTAATLTADQLVGGQVGFAAAGGAADIALPSVEDLFQYLTRDWFQAASSPTSDVGATTALTLPSIPVQYFDCTFTTGAGSTPSLVLGDLEYYADGPANPVSGLTKITLAASQTVTFRFFPIQYTSTVSPRIGLFVQSNTAVAVGATPAWAAVLGAGNVSGGTDPTISATDNLIFADGIRIGSGANATSDPAGAAIGFGAVSLHINSWALGNSGLTTGDNQIRIGSNAGTSLVQTAQYFRSGFYDGAQAGSVVVGSITNDGTYYAPTWGTLSEDYFNTPAYWTGATATSMVLHIKATYLATFWCEGQLDDTAAAYGEIHFRLRHNNNGSLRTVSHGYVPVVELTQPNFACNLSADISTGFTGTQTLIAEIAVDASLGNVLNLTGGGGFAAKMISSTEF